MNVDEKPNAESAFSQRISVKTFCAFCVWRFCVLRVFGWVGGSFPGGFRTVRDARGKYSRRGFRNGKEALENYGRKRGGGARRLRVLRGRGDLSHHAVVDHARADRRVGGSRAQKHLRADRQGHGAPVRGGRRGRRARGPVGGSAGHHVHGVPGAAADDTQHVQDRGRADAVRLPRLGPGHRGARPLHLRRPQRRHVRAHDGVCDARRRERPGDHGPGRRRAPLDPQDERSLPALLRRLPHLPRDPEDRRARLRRSRRAGGLRRYRHVPLAGHEAREPLPEGDGAEPGHLLPGQGGRAALLRGHPRRRRGLHAGDQEAHGAQLSPLHVLRRAGREARHRRDGIRLPGHRGDRRLPERTGQKGRGGRGAPVPSLLPEILLPRAALHRRGHRGSGPLQGARLPGRAPL